MHNEDELIFAKTPAKNRANKDADKQAGKAIPLIPCPKCGYFQKAMIKYFRRKKFRGIFIFSMIVLFYVILFSLLISLSVGLKSVLTAKLFWGAISFPLLSIALIYLFRQFSTPKQ